MWPTSGLSGYIAPAAWGVTDASERGNKYPYPMKGPQRFKVGDKIRGGSQVGRVAESSLPPEGPQRFRAGWKNRCGPQVGRVAT